MSRRRGFTLIELLVVIAIIGILASMVFPVFARARESARKAVCLSNVKNIALAIQMYLADNNDTLVPKESRAEVFEVLGTWNANCLDPSFAGGIMGWNTNPYLRWPVVLDEYIKNRDVWRCPSATLGNVFGVISPRGGDYLNTLRDAISEGDFNCYGAGGCHESYPPGWGGDVTDTYLQKRCGAHTGGFTGGYNPSGTGGVPSQNPFVSNYGAPRMNIGLKLVSVDDPVRHVAVCESMDGRPSEVLVVAYPGICKLGCATCAWGPAPNWEDCPWTQECGAGDSAQLLDPNELRRYARHLGGVNLGYLDGHAAWINSQALVTRTTPVQPWLTSEQKKPVADAIVGFEGCRNPPPGVGY